MASFEEKYLSTPLSERPQETVLPKQMAEQTAQPAKGLGVVAVDTGDDDVFNLGSFLSQAMKGKRTRMPPMDPMSGGTVQAIPQKFQPRDPGPPGWTPTPDTPFAGIGSTDWKYQPGAPHDTGGWQMPGMSADDLQLLHRLGRRRMTPAMHRQK